jgi:ribosomal protein L35
MKTNKSFTKRFKSNPFGKILMRKAGQNHFNAKEGGRSQLKSNRSMPFVMKNKARSRFLIIKQLIIQYHGTSKKGVNALKTRRNVLKQGKRLSLWPFTKSARHMKPFLMPAHTLSPTAETRKAKPDESGTLRSMPLSNRKVSHTAKSWAISRRKASLSIERFLATLAAENPDTFKKVGFC